MYYITTEERDFLKSFKGIDYFTVTDTELHIISDSHMRETIIKLEYLSLSFANLNKYDAYDAKEFDI